MNNCKFIFFFNFFFDDTMDVVIREIENDETEIKKVKEFLFGQINNEYHIGPTEKFHYDILRL